MISKEYWEALTRQRVTKDRDTVRAALATLTRRTDALLCWQWGTAGTTLGSCNMGCQVLIKQQGPCTTPHTLCEVTPPWLKLTGKKSASHGSAFELLASVSFF